MKHKCESYRDGDRIVFTCPLCPDYERSINYRTNETTVKGQSLDIQHTGRFSDERSAPPSMNMN